MHVGLGPTTGPVNAQRRGSDKAARQLAGKVCRLVLLPLLIAALPAAAQNRMAGSIVGWVKDDRGIPQMGAVVTLLTATGRSADRVYTDHRGNFQLDDVLPGKYSLRVTLDRFLPLLKENIKIDPGARTFLDVNLRGLFSSLRLVFPSGGEVRDMSEDWQWVLRTSSSTRPVLRLLPEERQESRTALRKLSGTFSDTRGYAEVSAGGGARQSALANATDLGTAFAVATSLFGDNSLIVSGNLGYGSMTRTPAAAFHASYSRQMGAVAPEVSVTVRQLQVPLAATQAIVGGPLDSDLPRLETFTLGFGDHVELGDTARFEYGFLYESVSFLNRLNFISPYGRLIYNLAPDREIQLRYASGVPRPDEAVTGTEALRQEVSSLGLFPRMALENGRPTVQRTEHVEIAYRETMGNGLLEAAVYRDRLSDAALSAVVPEGFYGGGNVLPDLFSMSSTFNGGYHQASGFRVSYARKLRDRLQAAIGYGLGGALSPTQSELQTADPNELRRSLDMRQTHMLMASLSSELPGSGTRVVSTYQWLSRQAVIAPDLYNDFAARSNPGLNLIVRQPLPFGGSLPGRLEARAELRNLLKAGYIPIQTFDGGQMYLLQAIRSYRGALSFIF